MKQTQDVHVGLPRAYLALALVVELAALGLTRHPFIHWAMSCVCCLCAGLARVRLCALCSAAI